MRMLLFVSCWLPLLFLSSVSAVSLSDIDSLLADSLTSAYSGKVCIMIMHKDSLVYYRSEGGYDSTKSGQIASGSKTFSGLLMLKLAELGVLSLEDSVGKYIPYASQMGKGSATLRQSFSHTAGWDGGEGENFLSKGTLSLSQCVDSIIKYDPIIYTPGTAFKYTGVAMQVAGRCAEIAAGSTWNTLFTNYILNPIGLTSTEFCTASDKNPRIAGGVCSSPSDMLKLVRLIQNNGRWNGVQCIDSVMMQELWKDQTHHVRQIASPYPFNPPYNNPYGADTVYYGIGNWLDIYNPTKQIQEQISGAGAFGTRFWINRCNHTIGVLFTMSVLMKNFNTTCRIIDIVNAVYPNDTIQYTNRQAKKNGNMSSTYSIRALSAHPFNPSVRLLIALPHTTRYSLRIFNCAGRKMATLQEGIHGGVQSVLWNGLDANGKKVPSGIYCAVVTSPDGLRSAKFVLQR